MNADAVKALAALRDEKSFGVQNKARKMVDALAKTWLRYMSRRSTPACSECVHTIALVAWSMLLMRIAEDPKLRRLDGRVKG